MIEPQIWRALADPTRRAVFEALASGEKTVGELTAGFDISQPAVSQHLAVLKEARLVSERRHGRNAFYTIHPGGLQPLAEWIDRYRTDFWPEKIEKLKTVLKGMDQ
ncbi:metalloregulator ArsR/SmtB family transcription factor [Mesorhizobium sp. NBSH29]|uniref:ArsR/SmtB family transcription factor n=1 Tax=Mesorhizobium sp. NBSH29 TaxID=2654249 RepID=UPI001896491E|nr:metalloregulator ArsR/SmtB family transcription factor [Mesorhizobium sp. NBSH29]QPC88010.1 metalloregulator ArsR/SmtB family transcription factor [Mesorhizobium sp. NBSH29]